METSLSTYYYLLPEIIVTLTGVFILMADLIRPVRAGAGLTVQAAAAGMPEAPDARPWLAYAGVVGLALAALATLAVEGPHRTLFSGIFVVDDLGTFFKLLFIGIGILVLMLSVDALPRITRHPAEYYALIVWCTLGHMVLASAAELFTIFLALQLTSLPLIVLVAYAKEDRRSSEASLKYLILVLVSTAVLLYGMTLIYGALGTSTLSAVGAKLLASPEIQPVVELGLVLLLTGFAFKITAAPFHFWVPDVYEGAPAPVTAFLSVGSKFAGFALALRIVVTGAHVPLDWHLIFGVMAAISMILGNLAAIPQTNIKRMLAYSGIAQAGYLLVGMAAMSEKGIAGVLFYAVAYTVANLTAFGVVIFVANRTSSEEIADYAGMSHRAPLAALAMAMALLSLGGLPLLAGFMAKFYVFLFAVKAGLLWLVAIGVVNSVVSLYYYLRVLWVMYVQEGAPEGLVVPQRIGVALSLSVLGMSGLGLYPQPMLKAAEKAAAALFGG